MTLGTVLSLRKKTKMRSTKLNTSWQRSDTENHSTSPRSGMWLTFWWTTAQTRMCVLHETSNGSPSDPAEIPIGYRRASVGKFCTKVNDRFATFTSSSGTLRHEEAGEIVVDRVRNHHELECWIKPGNMLAPVQTGGSSGRAIEPAGRHLTVLQAGILMDARPQGAYAPRRTKNTSNLRSIR